MIKGWFKEILRKAVHKCINYLVTYKLSMNIISKMLIESNKELKQVIENLVLTIENHMQHRKIYKYLFSAFCL